MDFGSLRACKAVLQCFSVLAVVKTWHGHLRVAKRLDKLFKGPGRVTRRPTSRARHWSFRKAFLKFLFAKHIFIPSAFISHFQIFYIILNSWAKVKKRSSTSKGINSCKLHFIDMKPAPLKSPLNSEQIILNALSWNCSNERLRPDKQENLVRAQRESCPGSPK